MQITVKIDQGRNIAAALAAFPELVVPLLREASTKSAFTVERHAKILSPVDTGHMRATIGVSLGIKDKGITSIVQTNVFYAIFVHEGTKRMRARPFMRQGAEQSIPAIQKFYTTAVGDALQKMKGMAQ